MVVYNSLFCDGYLQFFPYNFTFNLLLSLNLGDYSFGSCVDAKVDLLTTYMVLFFRECKCLPCLRYLFLILATFGRDSYIIFLYVCTVLRIYTSTCKVL